MATRTIRVGVQRPDAGDVLEYAQALIEEFGWNQMTKQPDGTFGPESSEQEGFTLHSAIGEACTRLSKAVSGSPTYAGSKDWAVTDEDGTAKNLRDAATVAVEAFLPTNVNDQQFNDQAKDAQEVLDVLTVAITSVNKEAPSV